MATFREKLDCLVNGYVRKKVKKIQENKYPMELIALIIQFLGNILLASQMVFDSFGIDKSRMQIVNDRKAICLKGYNYSTGNKRGSSIRLKCAMPIASRMNNEYNIKSISWEINHTATCTFPNAFYFIGVVSNRIDDFAYCVYQGYNGIKDAYGILGNYEQMMNGDGKYQTSYRHKEHISSKAENYDVNKPVKIKYDIVESKLYFYQNDVEFSIIPLPTHESGITHWHPCIGLRDEGDVCNIPEEVIIE